MIICLWFMFYKNLVHFIFLLVNIILFFVAILLIGFVYSYLYVYNMYFNDHANNEVLKIFIINYLHILYFFYA